MEKMRWKPFSGLSRPMSGLSGWAEKTKPTWNRFSASATSMLPSRNGARMTKVAMIISRMKIGR
jgi:hypothetical protein